MIDVSASGHYVGDCRELLAQLPEACIQTCVTSPPYWGLRDYDVDGQIGLEATPEAYVTTLVEVFRGVRRALRRDGTLWLNLGDCYARRGGEQAGGNRELMHLDGVQRRMTSIPTGSDLKEKDLVGIPWMVAFALRADGWYLRMDVIWSKPNPMPESVTDRPSKAHEYMFLLSKSAEYFYDADAIAERASDSKPWSAKSGAGAKDAESHLRGATSNLGRAANETRNKRSVWTVASQPYDGAHFATFPPRLIEPCILAGSRPGDVVLDPFHGSGTTGMVAEKHGRRWIGFDINPDYAALAKERTAQRSLALRKDV